MVAVEVCWCAGVVMKDGVMKVGMYYSKFNRLLGDSIVLPLLPLLPPMLSSEPSVKPSSYR